jgi:hypothetical protein
MRTVLFRRANRRSDLAEAERFFECLLVNRALDVYQLNAMLKCKTDLITWSGAAMRKLIERARSEAGVVPDGATYSLLIGQLSLEGDQAGVAESLAELKATGINWSLHMSQISPEPNTDANDPKHRSEATRRHDNDEKVGIVSAAPEVEVSRNRPRPSAETAVAGRPLARHKDTDGYQLSAMLKSCEDSVAMRELIRQNVSDTGVPLLDPSIAALLIRQLAIEGDKPGIAKSVAEMDAAGIKRSDKLDRILHLGESELARMRTLRLEEFMRASKFREATRLFEHIIAHRAVAVNHLHVMMKLPANTVGKQELITRAINILKSTQTGSSQRALDELSSQTNYLLKRIEVSSRRCVDAAVSRAFF